nr:AMP-binding protein [Pseudomonadota bacterium]
HGVSHLLALPSLYELLLESLGDAAPALRTVIVAGEACPRALVENHARRRPWTRLYNEYGPTEAAVWSTVAECRPAADPQAPVPIGRPIPHSRVYLLDDQGRPVARGLKGEIYIAGPGLSPGYLGRPALTAARFAPAPAPLDMDGRLYRSGDLAYLDGRGELVFLGRRDDQVKRRGYRIEPGEIEALLREQPGVAQAVVLADTEGGPRLRAFVESATALDPAALTRALARRLPAYMIPDDLQVLPALPRSANGKIDRRALLALQPRQRRAPYAAPRSHAEKVLAALWGQLLGIDHVGRDDDFFALGGHSLLVAQLVHRIKAVLDADMPVGQVFRHRRLHDLAARLERAPEDGGLVILRPGDPSRPPLFCLHESAGDVHPYLALAAALPQEQPVYGLALNDPAADIDLTELAARHLDSLRRRRPYGPYALCGWSIGGVLALEVARSLEQAGEGVAFLGIIDAGFDADDAPLPWAALWALYADELTGEGRQRLAALPAGEQARLREALAGRPKLEQVRALLLEHAPRHRLPTRAPQGVIEYRLAAMASARRWLRDYAPPAVAADIHGWWAEETLRRTPDLPERWRQLCGRLHAAGVAGDHDGILQQADFLARFRQALAAQLDGVNLQ